VILVLAVCMIVLSVRFNNNGLSTELGSAGEYANLAFYGLMTASVIALMSAICGCISCKSSNRCCTVIFGCTLLPATALVLVFGITVSSVSYTKESELMEYCAKYDTQGYEGMEKEEELLLALRETINDVDDTVGNLISSNMCSVVCPCDLEMTDVSTQATWLEIFNDDEELEKFGRCRFEADGCDQSKAIISFTTEEEREVFEAFAGYDIKSYKKFSECFDDLKDGNRTTDQVSEEEVEEYRAMANSDQYKAAMDFITFFEGKFACSGICEKALFFYTLPMSEGPPKTTCLSNMKDEIEHNLTYMGITATTCGLVMAFTWLCQYTLWKKYDGAE